MTNRYTNEEWNSILQDSTKNFRRNGHRPYWTPMMGSDEFARYIDHTLLKLDATKEQIDLLCMEARDHHFRSVCVRGNWVERAVKNLKGSDIAVACVVGFPEGTMSFEDKCREARLAIEDGARELDMVMNYPLLLAGDYSTVFKDIVTVRAVAPHPVILKVILETSQLSKWHILAACRICAMARADFVKTSTGFRGHGATEEHVRLMRAAVEQDGLRVKASGGVKTAGDAVKMIEAGAERIGSSSGVWIMKESRGRIESITHEVAEGSVSPPPKPLMTRLYTE